MSTMLTLEHAIVYVHREAKLARTLEEHEDFDIALRLLGVLRDGPSSGDPFNLACYYAVGLCGARYLHRRVERAAVMRQEFLATIPDYDPTTEIIPDRDPTDGRRHYGNQFRSGKLPRKLLWDIAPSIALIDSLCGSTRDLGKPVGQISNSPTLDTNKDALPKLRTTLSVSRLAQIRLAQILGGRKGNKLRWSESGRKAAKARWAEDMGKKLLNSVSDYLYGEAQGARNAFEQDSYTLALHLMAAVRRGDPDPLLCASYAAFGGSFPIHVQRRADRQWLRHQEFIRCLPKEEQGGHKLLTLASSRVSRTDPGATGETNPPPSPTRQRVGDRATANSRELASVIPWPESTGVGDIASG